MEKTLKFNSQIATNRSQSERLLALGLKKETADMYWWQETDQYGDGNGKWHRQLLDLKEDKEHFKYLDKTFGICLDGDTDEQFFIPAWSLHRLIEMMPEYVHKGNANFERTLFPNSVDYFRDLYKDCGDVVISFDSPNLYDRLIHCIEWLIKEGYFNKGYLEE